MVTTILFDELINGHISMSTILSPKLDYRIIVMKSLGSV